MTEPKDGCGPQLQPALDSNGHPEGPQQDEPQLARGDRVRVVKLQGRSEMNGLTGTLICRREDRWHVKLDDSRGNKLMWPRNLERLTPRGGEAGAAAAPPPVQPAPRAETPPAQPAPPAETGPPAELAPLAASRPPAAPAPSAPTTPAAPAPPATLSPPAEEPEAPPAPPAQAPPATASPPPAEEPVTGASPSFAPPPRLELPVAPPSPAEEPVVRTPRAEPAEPAVPATPGAQSPTLTTPPATPQPAAQQDLPQRVKRRRYYIAGSWDSLTPHPMNWDWRRKCFQYHVKLGVRGFESFQVLADGDWKQCFYPDQAHACPHIHYDICGPDDMGASTFWTIGRHPLDRGAVGARYEVRLSVVDGDSAMQLDWSRLGTSDDAATATAKTSAEDDSAGAAGSLRKPSSAPSAPKPRSAEEAAEESQEDRAMPLPRVKGDALPTLREFIEVAKPEWKGKDVTTVLEKLVRAGILSTAEMCLALRGKGKRNLNGRLKAVGEKTFGSETLQRLRECADNMDGVATQQDRPLSRAQLPAQLFEVVHDSATVYDTPSFDGNELSTKVKGELLHGTEETFDGFVHLVGEEGWVSRDARGYRGAGRLLKPLGKLPVLASVELCHAPGPQRFRVTFRPTVAVREAPSTCAKTTGAKSHGDVVLADVQTYHGWLRLADEAGWILCVHSEYGQLLRPIFLEERMAQ